MYVERGNYDEKDEIRLEENWERNVSQKTNG